MEKDKKLLSEQAQAICNACNNSLTIICGGPGTGKTYTAGQLIHIIWNSLDDDQKLSFKFALAAPTGKAAANLQKSLKNAFSDTVNTQNMEAKTLHNLLGIKSSGHLNLEDFPTLSADLVIVDECSMVDARMMGYLFHAMKPGARLILLGDNYQLPAVEAGSFFADLINISSTSTVSYLKTCLRAELKGILHFASAINENNSAKALHILQNGNESEGVSRVFLTSHNLTYKEGYKNLLEHTIPFYKTCDIKKFSPQEILQTFNKFRILSPLRKGFFGVQEVNDILLKELKKYSSTSFIAPIILLKNDYRLDLFNGETGVVIRHNPKIAEHEFSKGDYAFFPSRDDEGFRQIPALLLPSFEYAYCMSVHKSQGSEFDHVLLLLPAGSESFGREILYTAVTRAKRKLEIYGEDSTITETIRNNSQRLSGLKIKV